MKKNSYLIILFVCSIFIACEESEPTVSKDPVFSLNAATSITDKSAVLGGSVEGEDITDKGFVYGTSSSLTEGSPRLSQGKDAGILASTLEGLSQNSTYFFAAYAIDGDGKFFKSAFQSFTTLDGEPDPVALALGDTYQGGVIYYLDGTGEHGLLAAPTDQTSSANWQTSIDACYGYSLEGNDNWRLPDIDELEFLYSRKNYLSGLADIAYWSSSVEGSNNALAYGVYFGSGSNAGKTFPYYKTDAYQHSRAIRDF